jgi:hypothetical protein
LGTIADQENSAVFGQYNSSEQPGVLLVVGNGSAGDDRSNAFTVNAVGDANISGNATINGEIEVGGHEVASVLTALLNTVDSLQNSIAVLQEQLNELSNGE